MAGHGISEDNSVVSPRADEQPVNPRVSVVMPTFNCQPYIAAALHSVQEQDLDNIEIIVIDDGSTDHTWDWLQGASRQDRRLHLLQTSGIGPAAARNLGIAQARADLVAFIDADDAWRPRKLAAQARFHEKNKSTLLSFGDYHQVSETGEQRGNGFDAWPQFRRIARSRHGYQVLNKASAVLFAENPVGTSTVMARRDVLLGLGGFDPELPSAEDWDLWLRVAGLGDIGFTDQAVASYLLRTGSETSKAEARFDALDIIYRRHVVPAVAADPAAPRLARARFAAARAQFLRDSDRHAGALLQHLRAFTIHPSQGALRAAAVDAKRCLLGR